MGVTYPGVGPPVVEAGSVHVHRDVSRHFRVGVGVVRVVGLVLLVGILLTTTKIIIRSSLTIRINPINRN
jgi:hypothetical protein